VDAFPPHSHAFQKDWLCIFLRLKNSDVYAKKAAQPWQMFRTRYEDDGDAMDAASDDGVGRNDWAALGPK